MNSQTIIEPIKIVQKELDFWYKSTIEMLPNVVVALIVVLVFWLLAKGGRSLAVRGIAKITDFNHSIAELVGKTASIIITAIGFFIVLGVLKLDKTVTSLLAGAGVLGLAVGFAFKEIVSDYMTGLLIAVRQPYVIGDIIETNGYMATVVKLDLRVTTVQNFEGQIILIPNAEIFAKPIVNYSKIGKRRINIDVGVSYDVDLAKVKKVSMETIIGLSFTLEKEPIEAIFAEFSDSSILVKIRFWIDYPKGEIGYFDALSQAVEAIHTAYGENNIQIPFPIQTIELPEKTVLTDNHP